MKNLYILLACLCYSAVGQDRFYDLYQYNPKTINPALMSLTNEQNFDFQHRDLLNGKFINGSPSSILLSYSNKINKINSGVGVIFSNESLGLLSNTNASLLYNYQLKLNEKSKLSFGTELRYQKQNADKIYEYEINNTDPVIKFNTNHNTGALDLGILYQLNKLHISIGAQNLLHTKNSYFTASNKLYNLYVFNEFTIIKGLKFTPSALYKTDHNNWYADFNSSFMIKNTVILGFTERMHDDRILGIYNAGVNIKDKVQLIVGLNTFSRKSYNINWIEFMLRVKISNEE